MVCITALITQLTDYIAAAHLRRGEATGVVEPPAVRNTVSTSWLCDGLHKNGPFQFAFIATTVTLLLVPRAERVGRWQKKRPGSSASPAQTSRALGDDPSTSPIVYPSRSSSRNAMKLIGGRTNPGCQTKAGVQNDCTKDDRRSPCSPTTKSHLPPESGAPNRCPAWTFPGWNETAAGFRGIGRQLTTEGFPAQEQTHSVFTGRNRGTLLQR